MVHHDNALGIGAIHVGKDAAGKQRHLQRFEIPRGDVDPICSTLLACLLAIVKSNPVVSDEFVREIQSDGGILHSRNLSHGSRTLLQELLEGCGIVVTNIVERGFRDHHAVGIESWWQRLQMSQASDKQAGAP